MDNYVLKLSGKAELPEPLEIGLNFSVLLEGSIVAETITDNDDGTRTHYFKFKPVIVEAIKKTGERIRAKDTRGKSQQLRALLYRRWREENEPIEFDIFYEKRMTEIMSTQ